MVKFLLYNKKIFSLIILLLLTIGVVESSLILFINCFVDFLVNKPDINKLYIYVLIGLGISLCVYTFNYIVSKIILNYTINISHLVRKDFLKKILDSPLYKLNNHESSYYISFILHDIPKLVSLNEVILSLISNIVYLLLTLGILTYMNWKISLLAFACLIINVIPLFAFYKKINSNNIKTSNQYARYTSSIKDSLMGLEIIKTNICEDFSFNNICKEQDELKIIEKNLYFTNNKQRTIISFFSSFTYFSLVFLASYLILRNELGISIISVLIYCSNLLTNISLSVFGKANNIFTTKSLRKKYKELTEINTVEKEKVEVSTINGIEFKNVFFSYKDRPILKNINLTFEKGKKYLIIGRSGAGKTTLFNLLINGYESYDGNILIDNTEFKKIKKETLYKNIVYIKQKPYVFSLSVKDNILLGNTFVERLYKHSIEQSELKSFLSSLQFGDNEMISEEIDKVSEGEKQRINIARGLYKKGVLYLLDEINSSLDKHSSEVIERNILGIKDSIVINIAHKFSQALISMYDKIILIEDGEIVFAKPYSKIKDNPKFIFYKEELENEDS